MTEAKTGRFPIRYPLYAGEIREREVHGTKTSVEPMGVVERLVDTSTQALLDAKMFVVLHMPDQEIKYHEYDLLGEVADPIRLYRAVQILDAIDTISNPWATLADSYDATYVPLRDTDLRKRMEDSLGRARFRRILRMNPPNLLPQMGYIRGSGVQMDTRTLEREIKRGRIKPTPWYDEVIEEAKHQREGKKSLADECCLCVYGVVRPGKEQIYYMGRLPADKTTQPQTIETGLDYEGKPYEELSQNSAMH